MYILFFHGTKSLYSSSFCYDITYLTTEIKTLFCKHKNCRENMQPSAGAKIESKGTLKRQ